jgi:hypothetical protein
LTTRGARIADRRPEARRRRLTGGRHDRDLVLEEAEPVIADPARAANAASPAKGGPPPIDLVLEDADWRLRHRQVKTLAAFARDFTNGLKITGCPPSKPALMQADHRRSRSAAWNA